ncbi:MAG TPA: sigma-70 family RNA polymerase sigma factor [Kofleriaceae bacterium]|jgi:RNA polymerase sigma-70 factor (ECF subfamily)|nr:sigma-70 family RNA polymerase sigma factor [Kofleriaceae bacterium]
MDVEAEISQLRAAGQLKEVATLTIEGYGPEILSFLGMMLRNHADASDAFAQACEDLWKGLPRFEGRSSLKTWFYTLARHAASRLRRSSHSGQLVAISEITDVAHQVRSRTRPHLRTEVKTGFAEIRAMLDDSDRMLLMLRVDRAMSWTDVARVMIEEGEDDSDAAIGRVAARLRKRFQSVKETIRSRAVATGLIGELEPGRKA